MNRYFLVTPPSTMEDEGRYHLTLDRSFSTVAQAQKARREYVEKSKGWFKEDSILIVCEL